MKNGRPTDYTEELADKICAELADGKSMRMVCKADGMPDKSTVFRWLRTKDGFRDQYARAKEESADALTDEMLDIADDSHLDYIDSDDGSVRVNAENIQRSRLRIDTRKWLASKLKPKKYGDKQAVDHTSSDGSMASDGLTSEERQAKIQALLAKQK